MRIRVNGDYCTRLPVCHAYKNYDSNDILHYKLFFLRIKKIRFFLMIKVDLKSGLFTTLKLKFDSNTESVGCKSILSDYLKQVLFGRDASCLCS